MCRRAQSIVRVTGRDRVSRGASVAQAASNHLTTSPSCGPRSAPGRGTGVAERLELGSGPPLRPPSRIPQLQPNPVEQVDVLRRPTQIPAWAPSVAGLVIAMRRIVTDPGVTRTTATVDQIYATADAHQQQGGNAALGEREVVGT